mgnify:CR=1 FL=1
MLYKNNSKFLLKKSARINLIILRILQKIIEYIINYIQNVIEKVK